MANFKPKLNASFKAYKKAEEDYKRALAVSNNHHEDLNAMELSASLLRTLADAEKTETALAPGFSLPPDDDPLITEYITEMGQASLASRHGDPLAAAATALPLRESTRRSLFASDTTDSEQLGGNSTTDPPPHSLRAPQPQDIPPFAGLKSTGETDEDYEEIL